MNSANQFLCRADVVRFIKRSRLPFGHPALTAKAAKPAAKRREVSYWLLSLVALLSFSAGYYLVRYGMARPVEPDQVPLAAEGLPNQDTVGFDQVVAALSRRH
jgi:hypothetical protein